MTKYEPFKDVFKDYDRKFTQSISRTCIFITQRLFNERFLVGGYSLQTSLICGSKFWQIFYGYFFPYDETLTIPSQLIFAFALLILLICNMLMVQKEELLIKSPKLEVNHAHNDKLKSRSF